MKHSRQKQYCLDFGLSLLKQKQGEHGWGMQGWKEQGSSLAGKALHTTVGLEARSPAVTKCLVVTGTMCPKVSVNMPWASWFTRVICPNE